MKKKEPRGRADHIDQFVSKKLKLRRMMLGLSQQDLGGAVDVSVQQIQKYEKATNRISSGKLHAFAKFLNVPVNYFFSSDEALMKQNILAEEAVEYSTDISESSKGGGAESEYGIADKEVVALMRAFSEIKNPQSRKKVVELVKTMKE